MGDFTISEMKEMQQHLQEKYKDKWEGVAPEIGQNKLLWMIGEIGEVIDVIKQNGSGPIMEDPAIRAHLVEEMADVLMYYNDILLCFDISQEELKQAYTEKFQRNMTRW
ncbi:MAG: MazG-like family protein [Oscillospiraceae bacterium]|nr:MazG-like family protein [Oscillospiraceae bacterium]